MPVRQKMKRTQNETPDIAQGRDQFQTPNYATELLIPYLRKYKLVWEPAAGHGKIARVLEEHDLAVITSDIIFDPEWVDETFNFITQTREPEYMESLDYIITNPPFSLKHRFYQKCMEYWNKYNVPFALLVPADYSGWLVRACMDGAIKMIPTRRIDYITPSGLDGSTGVHTANFHSMWLTRGIFPNPHNVQTEVYLDLPLAAKKNI